MARANEIVVPVSRTCRRVRENSLVMRGLRDLEPAEPTSTGLAVDALLRLLVAAALEQEPGTAFGFIHPVFDQAGGCNIAMLVTEIVGFLHQ